MNYNKIYNSLVSRAKTRTLLGYKEIHHIIPKCLGGSDLNDNLVELTPEEHYLAHQLLTRIYPNNRKLVYAAAMMVSNRPTNKMYGWLKRRLSSSKSIEQSGTGNSQYGTCWVNHDIFGSKKIDKNLIVEYIEQGWILGKTLKYVKPKKSRVCPIKREEEIKLHRYYYTIYKENGFDEFVKITGYSKSKQNLVQRFATLLEEFVPQNGKKRTSIPQ